MTKMPTFFFALLAALALAPAAAFGAEAPDAIPAAQADLPADQEAQALSEIALPEVATSMAAASAASDTTGVTEQPTDENADQASALAATAGVEEGAGVNAGSPAGKDGLGANNEGAPEAAVQAGQATAAEIDADAKAADAAAAKVADVSEPAKAPAAASKTADAAEPAKAPAAAAKAADSVAAKKADDAAVAAVPAKDPVEDPAGDTAKDPAKDPAEEDDPLAQGEDAAGAQASSVAAKTAGASKDATSAAKDKTATAAKSVAAKSAVVTTASQASVQAPANVNDGKAVLVNGGVYLISSALLDQGAKAIDVNGGSSASGANIQIYKSNNTLAQYWIAIYLGNGIYQFGSEKSANVLYARQAGSTVVSGANVATAYSTKADESAKNTDGGSSSGRDWHVYKNSDGTFSLAPVLNKALRMDIAYARTADRTNVQVWRANGTKSQNFFFTLSEGLTEAAKTGKTVAPGFVELQNVDNADLKADIAGESKAKGGNVELQKSDDTIAQRYQLRYVGRGLYELQDANSTLYVDVKGGSKSAGANVQQWTRNNTTSQLWYLKKTGGNYEVRSALSNLVLAPASNTAKAGANLQMAKPTGSAAQCFKVKNTNLIPNATFVLQSAVIAPMVVSGASASNRANLQTARSNGSDIQKFKFTSIGGGKYTIQNVESGKYIDVAWGSKDNNANVWLSNGNGTTAQQWIAELCDGGTIMFKNVKSGHYLDIRGGSYFSGTNIQQHNKNSTASQQFNLRSGDWRYYSAASTSLDALKIITKAEEYEGWPYQWGGRSPAQSFDCAGLVMYCANKVWNTDYDLMYTNADRLYSLCTPVSASEAKVGDFVFYRGTYGSNVNYISHVVLYCGNGIMYGAGDPIGYGYVNSIRNIRGQKAAVLYARAKR